MSAIRVLHVDDEPDIREVVQISLDLDPEFTVRSCSSGKEAINVANDWLPDLILLDVMMPGMDGKTTLLELRANGKTSAIPVIFLTSQIQRGEIDAFYARGADGVIAKPFDPLSLAKTLRQHLQSLGIHTEVPRGRLLDNARDDSKVLANE